MKRPSRHSEHIAANALDAASQKGVSRAYTARVQRFADYLRQHGAISDRSSSTAETPSPLNAFRDWLLRHRGLAHGNRGAPRTPDHTNAAGARHGRWASTMQPRCAQSSWTRYAAVGPLKPKRSSERFASIYDSSQRMAHVNLVSTICCQPWRNGSFPRCRGTSTPIK